MWERLQESVRKKYKGTIIYCLFVAFPQIRDLDDNALINDESGPNGHSIRLHRVFISCKTLYFFVLQCVIQR